MKREIKFRAWDKKNNQYWFQFMVSSNYGSAYFPESKDLQENWIVEQFTGLKDKNGVEIYEGDIIQYNKEYRCEMWNNPLGEFTITTKKGFVFFKYGGFYIDSPDLIINLTDLPKIFNSGENINARWEDNCFHFEVIGSIHQNPELLNG